MKLSTESVIRLKQLVADGLRVYQECEDLQEGLKDTIKNVAKELDVKPAIVTRLIKHCHKNTMNDSREDNEVLEELYKAAGLG